MKASLVALNVPVVIFLCLGITGVTVGVCTHFWWVIDSPDYDEGLWKTETLVGSITRDDILQFKDPGKDKDIVLLLLIIGGTFGLVTLLWICFVLCSFNNNERISSGKIVSLFILPLLNVGSSCAAVVYSEIQFKDKWDGSVDRGYSVIFVYVGAACFLVSTICSFFLVCWSVKHNQNVEYVPSYPSSSGTMSRGYELK